MGITIQKKPEPKVKVKPTTMVVKVDKEFMYNNNRASFYAQDSFWEAWEKHHFDLNLLLAFSKHIPQHKDNEEFKITDGKNVIIGKRITEKKGVLIGGYVVKSIYTEKWAQKYGFVWTPHRQIRINIDHKKHFISRYKQRDFDLSLVTSFISRVPMAKLGQRIKIIGPDDIIIGTRTTEYGAILISGMRRGEIDFEDYVDYKI